MRHETSVVANLTVRLSLPSLPTFAGDEAKDDKDTFDQWIPKQERYAKLEQWDDREKSSQLELRLKGRAKQLFIILPKGSKCSFSTTVDRLRR